MDEQLQITSRSVELDIFLFYGVLCNTLATYHKEYMLYF